MPASYIRSHIASDASLYRFKFMRDIQIKADISPPPNKEVHFMVRFTAKYDFPDSTQSIDLQTGMACRIWL